MRSRKIRFPLGQTPTELCSCYIYVSHAISVPSTPNRQLLLRSLPFVLEPGKNCLTIYKNMGQLGKFAWVLGSSLLSIGSLICLIIVAISCTNPKQAKDLYMFRVGQFCLAGHERNQLTSFIDRTQKPYNLSKLYP